MNQNHLTEIERYGGVEGYRKEMARRRAMRKTYQPGGGPGAFTSETSKAARALRKNYKKRNSGGKTPQVQDPAQDFDRTEIED